MSGGSVAFNYSHLGSIYASAARSFRTPKEKNLCSGGFMGAVGAEPFFLPRRLAQLPYVFRQPLHLILYACCIKL